MACLQPVAVVQGVDARMSYFALHVDPDIKLGRRGGRRQDDLHAAWRRCTEQEDHSPDDRQGYRGYQD